MRLDQDVTTSPTLELGWVLTSCFTCTACFLARSDATPVMLLGMVQAFSSSGPKTSAHILEHVRTSMPGLDGTQASGRNSGICCKAEPLPRLDQLNWMLGSFVSFFFSVLFFLPSGCIPTSSEE